MYIVIIQTKDGQTVQFPSNVFVQETDFGGVISINMKNAPEGVDLSKSNIKSVSYYPEGSSDEEIENKQIVEGGFL